MGPCRGRLWWPVVALLAAAAVSVTNAQVNAVNSLNKAQHGRESSKLSPLGHHQLHDDPNHLVENDKTRLNQKEENPHVINAGHQPLTFVKHAHKRRVISKREAKKPKNTKRRVKFNKKEFEKKLQQQEKEEKESGVAKDESTVDTSEVLSSSNSLIPESGKERGGSSSTYESYSESSDSEDKNDIDDDDEDDDDSSDDDDEEEDDDSSDTSEDKTESTEEISLTSEEEKKSKDVSMSAIPHSGPDSSPPASSDSTDESSGSKAISGSSSDYSEISYTMSSSAEDAFPVQDSSADETKEKEVDGSASNEKAKTKSEKKAKIKAAHKTKKGKRVKLGKKSSKNRINVNDNNLKLHPLSDEKEHSLNKKTAEDHSLRLEMTTGNVLYMEKDEHLKEKSKQLSDREVHFQVTTERVLNLHNAAKKEEPSRSAAGSNPSSSRRKVSTNGGSLASKERPAMELLKVKPADPNRKSDLEQELIKDYPENGTVEITNWAGTFAPIHGEPYVAPLHHQPDEFWDAIYTSKDPDLPTPPGADVSEEATVKPLKGPEISMRRLATMVNHPTDHLPDPSHFGPNTHSDNQPDHSNVEDTNKIEAKDKNKGTDKTDKKKPKLTLKEKRKKKKEKKENLRGASESAAIVMAGTNNQNLQNQPSVVVPSTLDAHKNLVHPQLSVVSPHLPPNLLSENQPSQDHPEDNNKIEAKEKNKAKKNEKKKAKSTLKEKRKKKKEKKDKLSGISDTVAIVAMAGTNHDIPQNHPSTAIHSNLAVHDDGLIHPLFPEISPHFPGKEGPNIEPISANLHAKDKSDESLKTPSEEERESGTTYRPEGNYEYPSFRHPEFNPDTAYDENGIPIHESPGWTPPPTLPGDNRFGKGRNQAGAGMKHKANGPIPIPQIAKKLKPEPKKLAVSVTNPKYSLHPEDKMINNYHGLQDHLALLEHQKAVESHQGLHLDPLHPSNYHGLQDHLALLEVSHENVNLPMLHKKGIGVDNINHRIRKRKAAVSGSLESLESISQVLDSDELKVGSSIQNLAAAKETAYSMYPESESVVFLDEKDPIEAYERERLLRTASPTPLGGTRTTRLTKQAWLKNISLAQWRPTGTTRPTRKEPYTGFVFTQRPRRFQPRDYRRNEPNPVMPPQQRNQQSRHSTRSPPHLQPPTTPRPESTTEWWPPGVSHGPPPISRIPIGIIYPEIGRWEADLTNVRVRTSATRMTYPPEVVNYPVTFDWNFPRHLRKDKWTQRPDWPLESPLWSSEAYDYLEERTLPRILESGETEFPPTSPLPWWTYPPWWLQKKETETVNGTTPRPYTRKTTVKNSTTNKSVNNKHKGNGISEFPESKDAETSVGMVGKEAEETTLLPETTGLKADVSGINRKLDEDSSTYMTKSSKVKASGDAQEKDEPEKISENIQQQRKIHHKGPWWHLTVVEHFTAKTPKDQGNKRIKRSPKLVRQNAFRRKWKKFRETKNSSHTIDLNKTKSANVTEGCESPSIQRVLSNYSFTWPKINNETHSSKVYIEKVLMKALDELKTLVTEENKPRNNLLSTLQGQTHLGIENHIADLRNIFLIAVNNYHHKKGCSLLFNVIINEIGSDMVKSLLNHTNIVRQQLDRLLGRKKGHRNEKDVYKRYVEQSKLISIYKLLYNHNFLNRDSSEKINNILKNVLNINIDFLNSNYTNTYMSSNKGEVLNHKHNSNIKHSVMKNIFRRKREDITDITECPFNLSAQSVERVVGEIVDEIVDEIPVDEINEEVKTDVLTAMHENQLKRLGKTNINKNVLREMAKIESVDEAKFRNATEDSVRKVIMKMVNEVLNTLRKNSWMKDLIIKLFEEGYSVDSVLETISNQISIEELMNGMEKDGINITRYQKRLVLDEFKGYKTLLRKMLNKEVQLWEYQLTKNQSLIRYRRDLLDAHEDDEIGLERTNHKIYIEQNIISSSKSHIPIDSKQTKNDGVENFFLDILRVKRDINDNEISKTPGLNIDDFDLNDEDLDKELAELKKSSMPKREKIKVLKKRLKGLLDQTENPKDIVFPDNFEEELMRTENFYDEEVTPSPQRFKQRIRWNVRTKKPTTKVITYPMKIRLNRGRPFVPLTTTEEQTLIMVVTKTPSRRSRTKKPPPKKVVAPTKSLHFPTKKSTESKDRFWFDFTTSPTSNKIPRSTDKFVRRTLKPAQTLPTLRTFKTMKFIQKTQQPVISIQEFLKRRNKFKKQKVEDMFNRPSKDDGEKLPDTRNLSDSEEEEFSFGAEEVTFPSVLSTSDPTNTLDKPSFEKTASSTEPLTPMSSRVVMKKTPRRKTALHQNRTRLRAPTQAYSVAGTNLTNGIGNKSDSTNPLRRKRDLTFTQPFTTLKEQLVERGKRDVKRSDDDFVETEQSNLEKENKFTRKQNIQQTSTEASPRSNETSEVIKKPNSSLVHKKPAALMRYLYRIKDCVILKKKQLVHNFKEHVNQKAMEDAALWVLSYVAKAYHFLRKKIEEHANDSMEGKDLSMRS